MKSVPLTLVFIALLAFHDRYECSRAIWRTICPKSRCRLRRSCQSWRRQAFSALFAEDADFVVITGKYLKDRNEIVTYHAGLFADDFQGSHFRHVCFEHRYLE
jgi:hypothetical protein